ncbi:MAG TPA: AAA family ATPase [Methylococcus sp.]|nr:AAA family ATPase [Methylococcus sp.]
MRLPSYQDLSKEQDRINNLPLDGSYLVTGPPGTGKTVMALYRASMLQSRRRPVKVLMHGRLLAQYTRAAVEELQIDGSVSTYHRWLADYFWSHHRRPVPSHRPFEYDWPEILRIVNRSPAPDVDNPDLIIDEGQDLPKELYVLARLVSRNLTVFADENQRLTESNSTLNDISAYAQFSPEHLYTLRRNYRNTREIAELAATYYTGLESGIAELPTRSGDKPVVVRHRNLDATVEHIRNFESANRDLDIGVIAPNDAIRRRIVESLDGRTVNPVQTYHRKKGVKPPELDFETPGMKVINYQSAKGLEFDAVFLPAMQEMTTTDHLTFSMRMYVLTSRARNMLFLSYSSREMPPALADIPRSLVEVRE